MITIVACDDHRIVCVGIQRVLSSAADMSVLAAAVTPDDLLEEVARLQPTIALLDINLGSTSGLDLIDPVTERSPETKIIFFTMYDSTAYVRRAKELGARGYITKDRLDHELIDLIREVVGSDGFVSSVATTEPKDATAPVESLTARELDVLTMLAQGMTNAEIATSLYLSRRTVESHRARIQIKLGLKTRAELARALAASTLRSG